jgi:hypothetical protein
MAQKKTVASWKSRKRHDVILPSGAEVTIEIPNLPLLAKTGRIPNALLNSLAKLQTKLSSNSELSTEDLEEQREFTNLLVSLTVIEPKVEPGDVDELPFEDVEMIVEFALRLRDMDAAARHMGGLEKLDSFREARIF